MTDVNEQGQVLVKITFNGNTLEARSSEEVEDWLTAIFTTPQ